MYSLPVLELDDGTDVPPLEWFLTRITTVVSRFGDEDNVRFASGTLSLVELFHCPVAIDAKGECVRSTTQTNDFELSKLGECCICSINKGWV